VPDCNLHTVGDTLSLISHTFTLHPGDLLATETPDVAVHLPETRKST
jgi:2-keto-4-pentenoate hydratase/2-oxohepta-3-ene-1,7-dioic acid hydratase in catechol pathway